MEARRLAQIAIFVTGLFHLDILFGSLVGLIDVFASGTELRFSYVLISIGLAVFVLSLLLFSGGWAALIDVPGTVSGLSDLSSNDLLRLASVALGLYFLVVGVADAVGAVVHWQQTRAAALSHGFSSPIPMPGYPEPAPFVQALLGAGLFLWGSQIPDLIHRLRHAGHDRGTA